VTGVGWEAFRPSSLLTTKQPQITDLDQIKKSSDLASEGFFVSKR